MSIGIAETRADERNPGMQRRKECARRGCAASVVRHLEHVHRRVARAPEAGRQQLRVDVLLDVAGQQHAAMRQSKIEDDRDVVDGAAVIRGMERHLAAPWPQDVERGIVQPDAVSGCEEDGAEAELRQ
jgi:hypothetical protein